jgi:hypothetical protein
MHPGSYFEGESTQGNFQEALDNAVAAARSGISSDFIYWKLAETTGANGGFVNENTLRVGIYATPPLRTGGETKQGDAQAAGAEVPSFRSGLVRRLHGPDFCMDGAKYLLSSVHQEDLRLRPTNEEADAILDRLAGSRQDVTVAGYFRFVECLVMDVYAAWPTHALFEQVQRQS